MNKSPHINFETTLFLLALVLAISVRFINLGTAPLTDSEAELALQAHQMVNSDSLRNQASIGPEPAYILLTGLLFQIFGSTTFLARFWPALAGTLLVLAVYLFRSNLGRKAVLIAAFGIAIDPGLVSISRTADGSMMALGFAALGIATLVDRRPIAAGVLGGLALLSGPSIFLGLVCLVATATLVRIYYQKSAPIELDENNLVSEVDSALKTNPENIANLRNNYRMVFGIGGLTFILLGTAFFRYPQGLSAWAQSLLVYLSGWMTTSGTSPLKVLTTLVVYQPFGMAFAIVAIGRWFIDRRNIDKENNPAFLIFILLFLSTLTHILFYPGRQVSDLIWTLVPLWALAGVALKVAFPEQDKINNVSILQAALILILAALFWITIVSTNNLTTVGEISPAGIRAALLSGIVMLGILTTVLVGLGWSPEISRNGFIWGISAAAIIYLISAMWGASQLRAHESSELWSDPPGTGQISLIVATLEDLSNKNIGMSNEIEILSTVDSPSLRWMMRGFLNADFRSSLSPDEMPPVILTPLVKEMPALTSSYRGQDFVWKTWPGWEGIIPEDFIAWLTFRTAPIYSEKIILWARSDQFPGGSLGAVDPGSTIP